MFSVSFTRFVLKRSKAAKSSVSASHALGPGFGVVYPGAVEVPEDDQNDAGRGDVGQDAAMSNVVVSCMWWLWACVTWQTQTY